LEHLPADRPNDRYQLHGEYRQYAGGGPRAAWQRWRLQAGRGECLGHNDVTRAVKRQMTGVLHSTDRLLGDRDRFAAIALRQVVDIANPKILELGSGSGCLSRKLLDNHPPRRGDRYRRPSPLRPAELAAAGAALGRVSASAHHGTLSSRRTYGPLALQALAAEADSPIKLQISRRAGSPARRRPPLKTNGRLSSDDSRRTSKREN
jgi:hypothetical protein